MMDIVKQLKDNADLDAAEQWRNSIMEKRLEIESLRAEILELEGREPRLVSFALDMSTCTLNYEGEEYYYDLVGSTK